MRGRVWRYIYTLLRVEPGDDYDYEIRVEWTEDDESAAKPIASIKSTAIPDKIDQKILGRYLHRTRVESLGFYHDPFPSAHVLLPRGILVLGGREMTTLSRAGTCRSRISNITPGKHRDILCISNMCVN